jgi:hypothetical protein
MPPKRVMATFIPEAWINDYAAEIDCKRQFDVTEQIVVIGRERPLR